MRTHTGPRFIVSSEGRESHQPQVLRASHTNSKILVPGPGREPRTFRIGVGRATTAPLALSCATRSLSYYLTMNFYHFDNKSNSCCGNGVGVWVRATSVTVLLEMKRLCRNQTRVVILEEEESDFFSSFFFLFFFISSL
jgi:hypothetical protein